VSTENVSKGRMSGEPEPETFQRSERSLMVLVVGDGECNG